MSQIAQFKAPKRGPKGTQKGPKRTRGKIFVGALQLRENFYQNEPIKSETRECKSPKKFPGLPVKGPSGKLALGAIGARPRRRGVCLGYGPNREQAHEAHRAEGRRAGVAGVQRRAVVVELAARAQDVQLPAAFSSSGIVSDSTAHTRHHWCLPFSSSGHSVRSQFRHLPHTSSIANGPMAKQG